MSLITQLVFWEFKLVNPYLVIFLKDQNVIDSNHEFLGNKPYNFTYFPEVY